MPSTTKAIPSITKSALLASNHCVRVRHLWVAGLIALASVLPVQATGFTISTATGAGADVMLNNFSNQGNQNFGARNLVSVAHADHFGGANAQSHGLMRFDLSGVNGTVIDAYLSMSLRADADGTIAVSMTTMDDADQSDGPGGWSENAVTANTNPGLVAGIGAPTVSFTAAQAQSGATMLLDTAAYRSALVTALNADTNNLLTLQLFSNTISPFAPLVFFSFISKEGLAATQAGDTSFIKDLDAPPGRNVPHRTDAHDRDQPCLGARAQPAGVAHSGLFAGAARPSPAGAANRTLST